ncbi:hypothetical protein [Enterococcus cecorum]|nr:hypothetical protein [Enterococcus cecorum]
MANMGTPLGQMIVELGLVIHQNLVKDFKVQKTKSECGNKPHERV